MKLIITALTSLALTASFAGVTAQAGNINYVEGPDQVVVPPVQIVSEPDNLFDGVYVVAFGGATMVDGDYNYRGKESNAIELSGGNYGAGIGWGRVTRSGLYFGAEAQYIAYGGADTVECHWGCYNCSEGITDAWNIRGLAGFQTGRTLLYGFAGYQETSVTFGRSWPNGSHANNGSGVMAGLNYGAGIEAAIGNAGMFIGAEYGVAAGGSFTNGKDTATFADIQTAQLRVGWRF